MKNIECKYCHKIFETDGSRSQLGKVAAHMRTCIDNPNREKNIEARKRGSKIMNQRVCERQHQQKLLNDSSKRDYQFKCKNPNCNETFVLNLSDRDYKKYLLGKGKYRQYCNKCAHSIGGLAAKAKEIKSVDSETGKIFIFSPPKKVKTYHFIECPVCKHFFMKVDKKRFCSNACKLEYKNNRAKYLSNEARNKLSLAGRKSATRQFNAKRSKNEIDFYNLCYQEFQDVEHNKPIFNGWDADILIPKLKIAIQWNGPWHYRQISNIPSSSLASIQNRDKIKRNEIEKAGWSLYVIKDQKRCRSSKKQKMFIKQHFDRFLKFIEDHKAKQFYEEFELAF